MTDLYLAEGHRAGGFGSASPPPWRSSRRRPPRIQHVVQSDNPALLVELLKELQSKTP